MDDRLRSGVYREWRSKTLPRAAAAAARGGYRNLSLPLLTRRCDRSSLPRAPPALAPSRSPHLRPILITASRSASPRHATVTPRWCIQAVPRPRQRTVVLSRRGVVL